jgi:exonuclease III
VQLEGARSGVGATTTTLSLLSWNVRGAGHPQLVDRVLGHRSDVIVLVDCGRSRIREVVARLGDAGYSSCLLSGAEDPRSLLIASHHRLLAGSITGAPMRERWLHAVIPSLGIEVGAVYLPLELIRDRERKRRFWSWLDDAAGDLATRPSLLVGDLNTGNDELDRSGGARYRCADSFDRLAARGWRDLYRELSASGRAYSWWSRAGNGYRIDHCLASPAARSWRPQSVAYLPGDGISDHAALAVELGLLSEADGRPV